ncbi:dihydrodipicolinate synthase family protein, partial [Shinella yambaruensis]
MAGDLRKALGGISGILVTPLDAEDRVAPDRLRPILDRALAAGLHVPVVNGNTGEFYALTVEEAEAMAAAVCALVDGRAPVVAGVGRSVKDACRLAAAARRA